MHATHTPPAEVAVTPADTLRDAALYLTRHGWNQGEEFADPTQPTPPACAIGAIQMATCGTTTDQPHAHTHSHTAQHQALRVLAGHLDTVFYVWGINEHGEATAPADVVADWNDEEGRTADQVITALNAAADDFDATHGGTS